MNRKCALEVYSTNYLIFIVSNQSIQFKDSNIIIVYVSLKDFLYDALLGYECSPKARIDP